MGDAFVRLVIKKKGRQGTCELDKMTRLQRVSMEACSYSHIRSDTSTLAWRFSCCGLVDLTLNLLFQALELNFGVLKFREYTF